MIQGSSTTLNAPTAVARDADGYLYVSDFPTSQPGKVVVFAPDANGDAVPVRTISGSHTGIGHAMSLAIDGAGYVYVANRDEENITVYAPGASGDVAPVRTISAASGTPWYPQQLVVDPAGDLTVATLDQGILRFHAGASGEATPAAWITDAKCAGVAVDAAGDLFCGYTSLMAFAPGADGNATPLREVTGAKTQIQQGEGIALLGTDVVFSDCGAQALLFFPQSANGNVAPVRLISGAATLMTCPLRPSIL
ncbi:MAG TPA: hypothetical protein VMU15_02460 [Anaeromyxobacter sp.]|nr:hypothetical protein [Anaeromyxobacter sp.]